MARRVFFASRSTAALLTIAADPGATEFPGGRAPGRRARVERRDWRGTSAAAGRSATYASATTGRPDAVT